ncbi:glycosyltransferase [Psychromarinibacter sp. C21-152]|uniref:Glycosyltransferase n=1 Tax=Psychromarinibacter sediminicola TaxID=3033385 RepID=A0AAE3NWJ0_9RHOB|nr:glycosyltransferase [Psychromarinibacter sediminicola]MDF0602984.1 glycosyltransferase [Psychromarinibacter sediminicola]
MEIRNQVIGLIRFSFATVGNFYPGFESVAEMEAFLFDRERLDRRFLYFEAFCLPSLAMQTDQDFTCILLVGANMPGEYKDRLRDVTAGVPCVKIVEAEPQHHYAGIKKTIMAEPDDGYTHRTTFRFDDDDAIDNGFVARLKDLAPKVAAVGGVDNPASVAHNLGFYLERRQYKTVVYPTCERTPISVGAALIAPVSYRENVYSVDHRQLPQYFNAYSDTQHYAYVRTIHQDNKANPHRTGLKLQLPNKEIDAILRERFGRKLGQFKHLGL